MSDSIEIENYDPTWPKMFIDEARRVKSILGSIEIEHHGSTAVPGLPAKPVIDMMVAISTIRQGEQYADLLSKKGYEHAEKRYREIMPERIVMIRRASDGDRKCHVHLMLRNHRMWVRQIAFRDYLRTHPECARDYADLKRSLAHNFCNDRHAYMMAKTEFINKITDLAIAEQCAAADA